MFLALPLGLLLPTVSGWLLLRLLEGKCPVLLWYERWVMGFLLGLTGTMVITFLAHIAGLVAFTRGGFLAVQVLLTGILAGTAYRKLGTLLSPSPSNLFLSPSLPYPAWGNVLIVVLGIWIALKILAGTVLLIATPPYYDDTFNNWNMRGKIFFETERLTLTIPAGNESFGISGVSSYPPTVPMVKAWLAALAGQWSDALAGSIHVLWYIAALTLLFCVLRRHVPRLFAILGTYILGSLPLYLIQGTNAYADIFLSAHLLTAGGLLFSAAASTDPAVARRLLRIGAVATALLIFTKNEALVLYLPPLFLLTAFTLWTLWRKRALTRAEVCEATLLTVGAIVVVAAPWIVFKWIHGLPFGNAKSLPGLKDIVWQPFVIQAIITNTFFEGNWIFLFPLLIGCLAIFWRQAFSLPLLTLTMFLLLVIFAQIPVYLFTGLSTEALNQTGYARGLVHIAPLAVLLVTLLLQRMLAR